MALENRQFYMDILPLEYSVCLVKGSDLLFMILYTPYCIYPSEHKQMIWTLFEAHIVAQNSSAMFKQTQ